MNLNNYENDINYIKNWIQKPQNKLSYNSCLFIKGRSGIGKTYLINKICNELDLFMININSNNCCNSKQFTDLLYKSFVSSLIQQLTNNTQKKIIIIDEIETLLSFDSTININLLNFLNTAHKHIPIICIINNNLKLGEIKKCCIFYELQNQSYNNIHQILLNYKNDITLKESSEIANKTNFNIKKCIEVVNNLYYDNVDETFNITELYSNNYNRNNFYKIIHKDLWIIPLKFHENLIIELNNRNGLKTLKYKFYKNFIYNFCHFDILMNSNNEIAINYFISFIYPLFNFKSKNNKDHSLNNFTKLLSYLSLQKKNNKKTYKLIIPNNQFNGNYHLSIINRKFIY